MKLGDKVMWSSQAQGYTKTKTGTIAQIVAPGERPDREAFPHLYKNVGCGFARNHESYVVLVGKKPYWPIVKKLIVV